METSPVAALEIFFNTRSVTRGEMRVERLGVAAYCGSQTLMDGCAYVGYCGIWRRCVTNMNGSSTLSGSVAMNPWA